MHRYFFDTHDGDFFLDEDGIDCFNFEAARHEAKQALHDIAKEHMLNNIDYGSLTIRVRNDQNEAIYTAMISFNEVSSEF